MPLTRDFKEVIRARMEREPEFKAEIFNGAIELLLNGEVEAGKVMLRDYINGTIGFDEMAELTGLPKTSMMRMLSKSGNPTASNLFAIIQHAQLASGIHVTPMTKHQ